MKHFEIRLQLKEKRENIFDFLFDLKHFVWFQLTVINSSSKRNILMNIPYRTLSILTVLAKSSEVYDLVPYRTIYQRRIKPCRETTTLVSNVGKNSPAPPFNVEVEIHRLRSYIQH